MRRRRNWKRGSEREERALGPDESLSVWARLLPRVLYAAGLLPQFQHSHLFFRAAAELRLDHGQFGLNAGRYCLSLMTKMSKEPALLVSTPPPKSTVPPKFS